MTPTTPSLARDEQPPGHKSKIETGWLIESKFSTSDGPHYWFGTDHPAPWGPDHLKAVRFCRREDAEAARLAIHDGYMAFVSEHQWGFGSAHGPKPVSRDDAPKERDGSWPDVCVQRAFVEGMQWWQFHHNGSTAFPSERNEAEAEAIRRYGHPKESK